MLRAVRAAPALSSRVGSGGCQRVGSVPRTPTLLGSCLRAASHLGKKSDLQLIPCSLLHLDPAKAGQQAALSSCVQVRPQDARNLSCGWDHYLLPSCFIVARQRCFPKAFRTAGPILQAHAYDDSPYLCCASRCTCTRLLPAPMCGARRQGRPCRQRQKAPWYLFAFLHSSC